MHKLGLVLFSFFLLSIPAAAQSDASTQDGAEAVANDFFRRGVKDAKRLRRKARRKYRRAKRDTISRGAFTRSNTAETIELSFSIGPKQRTFNCAKGGTIESTFMAEGEIVDGILEASYARSSTFENCNNATGVGSYAAELDMVFPNDFVFSGEWNHSSNFPCDSNNPQILNGSTEGSAVMNAARGNRATVTGSLRVSCDYNGIELVLYACEWNEAEVGSGLYSVAYCSTFPA